MPTLNIKKFLIIHNKVIHGISLKLHALLNTGKPKVNAVGQPEEFLFVLPVKVKVKEAPDRFIAHIIKSGLLIQINVVVILLIMQVNISGGSL